MSDAAAAGWVEALRIDVLEHRRPEVAARIHGVLAPAHAQELRLLRLGQTASPVRGIDEILGSPDHHLGAFVDGVLAGVLAIGRDDEPAQLAISLLAVHPLQQRRGIARRLVAEALQRSDGIALAVSTGADNAPALALYGAMGFEPYRRGALGPEALPMLKLRRWPQAQTVACAAASIETLP